MNHSLWSFTRPNLQVFEAIDMTQAVAGRLIMVGTVFAVAHRQICPLNPLSESLV
jgi:hypothetical protein